jgi:hypothetical protein
VTGALSCAAQRDQVARRYEADVEWYLLYANKLGADGDAAKLLSQRRNATHAQLLAEKAPFTAARAAAAAAAAALKPAVDALPLCNRTFTLLDRRAHTACAGCKTLPWRAVPPSLKRRQPLPWRPAGLSCASSRPCSRIA